ncbi:hypothetical protein MNBD_CHLOROFLEXI01-3989 [hydrothermal vent metagenome]|uniref:Uncharacterized protein n=1 Tax=hydrothermal vent metagenome TaxID=652676 RepID=A0A3B0VAJ9_9ZZZZ
MPQFEQILAAVQCDHQPETAVNQPSLIGMNINPPQDDYSFDTYREAVVQARAAGVQASHTTFSWADVETAPGNFDWTVPDLLIDTLSLEGIRLSLVLSFIHTSVVAPRPDDLVGLPFDDPILIERATDFVTAVVQRYGDQIDYLAFGNEVNICLADHPEDVVPFLALFAALETAVSNQAPNLPTGTTLAFHTAVQQNRLDLIELFQENDFLAYTYYPFGEAWSQFEAYLCTLGLRQNDGTPKLGWDVFVGEMGRFLIND